MDSVHLDLFFWHRRSLVRARHHGKRQESRQATRQNCPVDKTKRIKKKMKESVQRGQRRRALTTNSTTRRTRHDTRSKAHLTRWNGCATSHTPCVVRTLECSTGSTLGRADPRRRLWTNFFTSRRLQGITKSHVLAHATCRHRC